MVNNQIKEGRRKEEKSGARGGEMSGRNTRKTIAADSNRGQSWSQVGPMHWKCGTTV